MFKDCYADIVKSTEVTSSFPAEQDAVEEIRRGEGGVKIEENLAYIEKIESDYTCAGICRKGTFWFGKSVTEAPPEKYCLSEFWSLVPHSVFVIGCLSIVAAILLLVAWLLSFVLYSVTKRTPVARKK